MYCSIIRFEGIYEVGKDLFHLYVWCIYDQQVLPAITHDLRVHSDHH